MKYKLFYFLFSTNFRLSLKLQEDSASLAEAARAVEATKFSLSRLATGNGKHLQHFIDATTEHPPSYHDHQLKRVEPENTEEFESNRYDVCPL